MFLLRFYYILNISVYFYLQNESYIALNTRIKFVRLLLQILLSFNRRENHSSSMGETQRLLTTCGLLIPSLVKTVDKGVPKVDCEEGLIYFLKL